MPHGSLPGSPPGVRSHRASSDVRHIDPARATPVAVQVDCADPDLSASLLAGLQAVAPALILIFGAGEDVLARVASDLRAGLGADCVIAGCSSAGEIGPAGYASDSIVAIGFPAAHFRARGMVLHSLSTLPVSEWMAGLRRLHALFAPDPARQVFGVLLVDGMSGREDTVVTAIDAALPGVPVLGGSAGDGLNFQKTALLAEDQLDRDIAVFLLIETDLAVSEVSFAHFSPTVTRAVVTSAIPEKRRILELNAEPAAQEYARLTGIPIDRLTPTEFASHPLLLRMGRRHHVRAISAITDDGGLSLLSSIETGTVLTLGRAEDMTRGFAEAMQSLPQAPLMVLGFDCILRRLALERAGLMAEMSDLFARYKVAGFNTYGEQHAGMHVNQTFVGLAFMDPMPTGTGATQDGPRDVA